MIVRVDAAALMRGHPVDGEVVEIAGVGPVPVSAVRELLPEALVAVVVTKGSRRRVGGAQPGDGSRRTS